MYIFCTTFTRPAFRHLNNKIRTDCRNYIYMQKIAFILSESEWARVKCVIFDLCLAQSGWMMLFVLMLCAASGWWSAQSLLILSPETRNTHTHTLELLLVQVESRCTPTNQPSKNPATDKPTDADMTCEMSFYAIARQCREKVFVWKIWAEGKRTRAASRITSSRVVRVVFDTHTYTPIGKGEHMCPAREGRQGVSARKWCEIEWMIEIVKVHRAKTGYFNRILYWSWSK